MYTEQEARELVIEACRKLVDRELIARTWGNVSARIEGGAFIITPSGRDYDSLRPEDLVRVTIDGLEYEGDIKPSSEKGVHAAAYRLREDVNFVVHTHQFFASVIAAECRSTWVAPCAAYGLPGTAKLMKNVEKTMIEYPDDKAFLMARHGAVLIGSDPDEAFALAEKLENDSRKLFESRVPSTDVMKTGEADIAGLDTGENGHIVVARDEYVLECCRAGVTLKPYVDDFAQIAGPDIKCVENNSSAIRKALRGRNAVLVRGAGAVCTGKTQDDAEATAFIVRKNAACACYVRKSKPMGMIDSRLQRHVYLSSYSKLKNSGSEGED